MEHVRFDCPANITSTEQKRIEKIARDVFAALHCRDVARIDLRMAKDCTLYVIECNPLPGLAPDFSDLCNIAKVASMDFRTLIGEILTECIKRYRGERASASVPFATPPVPLATPPLPLVAPIAEAPTRLASAAPMPSTLAKAMGT